MATKFERSEKWERYVARVMKKHHDRLTKVEVKVDVLLAHKEGPLMCNGYPCSAKVRVCIPEERARGCGDALIIVDAFQATTWKLEQRDAILDHELTHLEPLTNKAGQVKKDDLDRPRLGMRKHDIQVGWFVEVAERHGAYSVEVQQAAGIRKLDVLNQEMLPFMDDEADEDDSEQTLAHAFPKLQEAL